MPEIEKKYVLKEGEAYHASDALDQIYPSYEDLVKDVMENGKPIRQGYLPVENGMALAQTMGLQVNFAPVEARLRDKAGKLSFTLKGDGTIERDELEVPIAQDVFDSHWPITEGRRVEKIRLEKPYGDHTLEIDVYRDRDLIVAEVELNSQEEARTFYPLGQDVTEEKRYKNKSLAK